MDLMTTSFLEFAGIWERTSLGRTMGLFGISEVSRERTGVEGRSELDEMGRPYPLLHMRLAASKNRS